GVFALGISSLLIVLTQVGQPEANPAWMILFTIVFTVCIPLFLWWERRTPEPMLDLKLWSDRLIASANGASLAAGMTLIGITAFLAVYVQGVMGRSATVAGLTLTMMAVGWPLSAVMARRFYHSFGMRGTLRLGSVLIVLGATALLFLQPTSSPFLAGTGSFVLGYGMGLLIMTCTIMIQGSVSWENRGSATASNVFARTLGNTLGAAVLGSVLNFGLHSYSRSVTSEQVRKLLDSPAVASSMPNKEVVIRALHHGLHLTFICVVVLAVVTVALSLFIPARDLSELAGGRTAQ
ncbi:MAG TPA: MFS transporter, partial [Fimbriimonadaceae bacterium]|nr:MFS transporter [Fimbriimonadaceae bacterium]